MTSLLIVASIWILLGIVAAGVCGRNHQEDDE